MRRSLFPGVTAGVTGFLAVLATLATSSSSSSPAESVSIGQSINQSVSASISITELNIIMILTSTKGTMDPEGMVQVRHCEGRHSEGPPFRRVDNLVLTLTIALTLTLV